MMTRPRIGLRLTRLAVLLASAPAPAWAAAPPTRSLRRFQLDLLLDNCAEPNNFVWRQITFPAPTTRVGFYYYSSAGTVVFSGTTCAIAGGLAAGANSTCTTTVSVPGALPAGPTYLIGVADDQSVVPESNENNNWLVATTGAVVLQ